MMTKTLEDLEDDLAFAHEEAKLWLERHMYHWGEAMTAHVEYMSACAAVRDAEAAILAAKGEPT